MLKSFPKGITTRKQSKQTHIFIKNNEDDDDDDTTYADDSYTKKITRENNHIYFYAEVDRQNIFELIEFIRKCEIDNIVTAHKNSLDEIPIYLHISSFGGSLFDAFTAVDVIQSCKVPVHTIIDGPTASAGTIMSVVGKTRYIRPNAYMLIHQLSSSYWGKMSELEDDFTNNTMFMKRIKDIYVEHASIPKKQLSEILKHDLWWDADKCIKYSLVDEVWNRS
jgi:ATP-dependent protease ClpP protease subunit